MLPNAENVSYSALLSIDLSRFFINIFPTPDLRSDGSLCDHMILIGFPLTKSKFIVSRARSATTEQITISISVRNHKNLYWKLNAHTYVGYISS